MPDSKEPHWRLNVAAISAIVAAVLSIGIAWAGKADKDEVDVVRKKQYEVQESVAVMSRDQKYIMDVLTRIEARIDVLAKQQNEIYLEMVKRPPPRKEFELPPPLNK
jgi:hypothetical protein